MVKDRGEDPVQLANTWADMINSAIADKPADMVTAMHLCRGNFRSTFVSSGGYEPVADVLFNKIGIDGYFLEYDSDRAGGFEPLRFLPKGKKRVVLGLVTSKTGDARKQGPDQEADRGGGEIRCRSTSSACRRNAASPPPRKAMCWPKTSNGRSCG